MNDAQQLFAQMYQGTGAGAQGAGPDMNQGAGQGQQDDDIIDGDYREV